MINWHNRATQVDGPISKREIYWSHCHVYCVNWFEPKLEGDIAPYALAMCNDGSKIISRHKSVEAAKKACEKHERTGGKSESGNKKPSRSALGRGKERRDKNRRLLRAAQSAC